MLQFILRRLGLVIPTFIGITLLTFAFVHMIPGDPVMIMAGERGISPERHAQLLAEMGLDKPLWQQYAHYIWGVLHGDLGISLKSRIPVWQEFVPRFKATLELGVCAMIFAVAVGIPVGVLAAVKRGSIFDHTAVGLALTGYSMPIFWWGMMLIMLVSVQLNLTPVSGRISDTVFLDDTLPLTGFMLIDTAIWGEQGDFIDALNAYDPARYRAGHHPAGGDRAYDPFVDAGSAWRRLYPYRARQRPDPYAGDRDPRAA
ncbi:dipeptide transport system permease DppB [Klebsiella pneumoniae]|nr:dipeptide transport system permease DppB [Klebsiella pneumoniae]